MANRFTDALFQLVHSLEKAEKRHFKLYIKRSSGKEDLKVVQLFDALDKMHEYDETVLLKKISDNSKTKLANLKTHLYKELLAALRLLKATDNIDLQLSEHLDNARILYNKGLKQQALRILEKAKEQARANQKFNTLVQLISLEKKIETLHITRSSTDKTEQMAQEALQVSSHIDRVTRLSNLALLLYRWYVIHGHARDEEDEKDIKTFFKDYLPKDVSQLNGFYEELYYYQSYCWYAFIRQDFLMYYRYAQKWVNLYKANPYLIGIETGHYIKGMQALLNSHFDLRNFKAHEEVLKEFEEYEATPEAQKNDNFRIHTSIYINTARINGHLMSGTFKEGLRIVPEIETKLNEYSLFVDSHRILVFNYKIALLYFGSGNYDKAIDYVHRIMNGPMELRIDLQCYARLIHLLSHYELGNYEILDSLSKSVQRFMEKMKNFTKAEEALLKFLKNSFAESPDKINKALNKLLDDIKHLEKSRHETRAFAYLDIISWAESKVKGKTMEQVVYEKYKKSKRRPL
ncbi:MAG: hypothetical protein KGZ74_13630 [Chitinophagaceae bacterium]|nr:hypothetical protein [Chitinophagaceae bacterium]